MTFRNLLFLLLLLAALSACSKSTNPVPITPPGNTGSTLYEINLAVGGVQQSIIAVTGIPTSPTDNAASPITLTRIFVYESSGKEILFDEQGNPSDNGKRIVLQKGDANTTFKLPQGEYRFVAQAEDDDKHRLAWGEIKHNVQDKAELRIPLRGVIGGIRLASSPDMKQAIPQTLKTNVPVTIYAHVYPEGRKDLYLPTNDYSIEYTVGGDAQKLTESTFGIRIALQCQASSVGVSVKGLLAQDNGIIEGDLGTQEFPLKPLEFCNNLVDTSNPWISLDYHHYQEGKVMLLGETLDLQQGGIDSITIYDGITTLGEATIQRNIQPHRWEFNFKLTVRRALQLRIVARDKAGNEETITRNINPGQTQCTGMVQIPDNKLELIIRHTLELPLELQGKIPAEAMGRLEVLRNDTVSIDSSNVSQVGQRIQSLTGLQCAANLKSLGLSGNFSDLSTLGKLKNLTELSLQSDKVTDLSPLSTLTNLQSFAHIGNNNLQDISPLASLTSLQYLNLSRNAIKDASALANLKDLRVLTIYNNQVEDISVVSNLKQLRFLWVSNNKLETIPDLSNLKELQQLLLDNNQIKDITPLTNSSLSEGNVVNLRGNPLNQEATDVIKLLRQRKVEVIQ